MLSCCRTISAEDCLYADLGVDPSIPGIQVYEATDLLLRKRHIDTTANLILFQVGCIGDLGFKFNGYENSKFELLLDYLEQFYGPDHIAINYVANMFNGSPTIEAQTISQYRLPEVRQQVSGISTFFIAARQASENDPVMGEKLGLSKAGKSGLTPLICDRPEYHVLSQIAKRNNYNHSAPPGYMYSFASEALYNTMLTLMLDPQAQAAFSDSPRAYLNQCEGLTADERRQLLVRHPGVTRMLCKRDPNIEAIRFVDSALTHPRLANAYRDFQQAEHSALMHKKIAPFEYEGHLASWLRSQGYATTPAAVTRAVKGVSVPDSVNFSETYITTWQQPGATTSTLGPVVAVSDTNRTVVVNGVSIKNPIFAGSVVTWMAVSGNPSSAVLSFHDRDGVSSFAGSYVEGSAGLPRDSNLFGSATAPSRPLSAWNGRYASYMLENGSMVRDGQLVIDSYGVSYSNRVGEKVSGLLYTGSVGKANAGLAWFTAGGNHENVILLFSEDDDGTGKFHGMKWTDGNQPSTINFVGSTGTGSPLMPAEESSVTLAREDETLAEKV